MAERAVRDACLKAKQTLLAEAHRAGKPLSARDVAMAAKAGDALAARIIRAAGGRLGETLAILVDVLNPQKIVIGGLALRLGDALLTPAREVMRREALSHAAGACEVVPAALDERIGDIACLCVAMGLD
jgi:glucokinase